MKVVFIGVGEAVDKDYSNTSVLIESSSKVLLDCGYSVPQQLLKYSSDPEFIDAIFISHTHADHYFGLAPLIIRFKVDGRKKPLAIISEKGNIESIKNMIELGYKDTLSKLDYAINFIGVEEGKELLFNSLKLNFAASNHPVQNLVVKLEEKDKSIGYRGDGGYSEESSSLFKGCDLLIHKCFTFRDSHEGHGTYDGLKKLFKNKNIRRLACVHVNYKEREKIKKLEKTENIFFPEAMEEIII